MLQFTICHNDDLFLWCEAGYNLHDNFMSLTDLFMQRVMNANEVLGEGKCT